MDSNAISQNTLISLIDYNARTGQLRWKKPTGRIKKNTTCGHRNPKNNSITVSILQHKYDARALVWLYVYGKLPDRMPRPRDGNRQNLKLTNLTLDGARKTHRAENLSDSKINLNIQPEPLDFKLQINTARHVLLKIHGHSQQTGAITITPCRNFANTCQVNKPLETLTIDQTFYYHFVLSSHTQQQTKGRMTEENFRHLLHDMATEKQWRVNI